VQYIHANDQDTESSDLLETMRAGGIKCEFLTTNPNELSITVSFNNLLSHTDDTVRISDHWIALLQAVNNNGHSSYTPVKNLSIVHGSELNLVKSVWSKNVHEETTKAFERGTKLLHTHFERSALSNPNGIALRYVRQEGTTEEVTYSQASSMTDHGAKAIYQCLHEQGGNETGELFVAILFPRDGYHAYLAMLSILKAGAAYVPIDPSNPPDRIAYILEDSNASLLVTCLEMEPLIEAVGIRHGSRCPVIYWSNLLDEACPIQTPLDIVISPSSACYSIYTSGSTGLPKGKTRYEMLY